MSVYGHTGLRCAALSYGGVAGPELEAECERRGRTEGNVAEQALAFLALAFVVVGFPLGSFLYIWRRSHKLANIHRKSPP